MSKIRIISFICFLCMIWIGFFIGYHLDFNEHWFAYPAMVTVIILGVTSLVFTTYD